MEAASIELQGNAGETSVYGAKKANEQAEVEGQAAQKLIEAADPNAEPTVDPLTGQNVNLVA